MSHYRKIQTTLASGAVLVQALRDLNVNPRASVTLGSNALSVKNGWDSKSVDVLVDGSAIAAAGLLDHSQRLFGDGGVGYAWDANAGVYELVYDLASDAHKLARFFDRVNQRYGVVSSIQAAQAAGWSVLEETLPDGTVSLTCTQY